MSRLITEDAVYEYLTDKFNEYDISIENEFVGKILDGLGDIPTAYDVEKVVAELEEEKDIAYADFDMYINDYELDLDSDYDDLLHKGLARAIDVIRKGGVE